MNLSDFPYDFGLEELWIRCVRNFEGLPPVFSDATTRAVPWICYLISMCEPEDQCQVGQPTPFVHDRGSPTALTRPASTLALLFSIYRISSPAADHSKKRRRLQLQLITGKTQSPRYNSLVRKILHDNFYTKRIMLYV